MIRRPPRSTHCISSAASDVYKRQIYKRLTNFKFHLLNYSFNQLFVYLDNTLKQQNYNTFYLSFSISSSSSKGYCGTTTGTKPDWNWEYGFYCCEDCWKEGEGNKD
eukprot:TRINITY_DN2093_c0_g1_i17.p2 TRINITY_DN2093_c0_g1~~TRINITY_DN2093_c0_g1_i17.p2  ORF type:complete len:106 (-),score=27.42 TRINITY_DN2093_c0_g1_i17:144-461(-)